jgi:hypothetical protein
MTGEGTSVLWPPSWIPLTVEPSTFVWRIFTTEQRQLTNIWLPCSMTAGSGLRPPPSGSGPRWNTERRPEPVGAPHECPGTLRTSASRGSNSHQVRWNPIAQPWLSMCRRTLDATWCVLLGSRGLKTRSATHRHLVASLGYRPGRRRIVASSGSKRERRDAPGEVSLAWGRTGARDATLCLSQARNRVTVRQGLGGAGLESESSPPSGSNATPGSGAGAPRADGRWPPADREVQG